MKKRYVIIVIFLINILLSGCEDVLEKENLTAINPDDVWNDVNLVEAYVNGLYTLMPGYPNHGMESTAIYTDEARPYDAIRPNPFGYGVATNDSYNVWPYAKIRDINFMLEEIDKGDLSDEQKNPQKGQGYFWRAWAYFSMVKAYGGVPLVLNVQNNDVDIESIQLPRNKTSECISAIIDDLDAAFELLPEKWDSQNSGRIDKGAAKAFKARVLLFYASPQFNPENNMARWQQAYDAAKDAIEFNENMGKGLYESVSGIWDEEIGQIKEGIMVKKYSFPYITHSDAAIRPLKWSVGGEGIDQPTLELVNAFPLIDGTPWNPSTTSYDTLHRHRSERFYATIGHNGHAPYLWDMVNDKSNLWTYIDPVNGSMIGILPTLTSFYRVKGLDRNIPKDKVNDAETDWLEIRFTELLMAFGEAANEIGNADEALQVLYDVRKRAGILSGSENRFGITATTKEDIREAYLHEYFLEFAFEGKRLDILRRLRQWDKKLNGMIRHGLKIHLKEGEVGPSGLDDINDFIDVLDVEVIQIGDTPFNIKPEYYFYGIPQYHLNQNPNLEQTLGWPGGTFDPLQ